MPKDLNIRFKSPDGYVDVRGTLDVAGQEAKKSFEERRSTPGIHLLATGDTNYAITLLASVTNETLALLKKRQGHGILVVFPGRTPLRCRLHALVINNEPAGREALDLTAGRPGAAPLYLLADGTLSTVASSAPMGIEAQDALVTAARWISSRRTSTFAELFPPSAFHPEEPRRTDKLAVDQGHQILKQVRGAISAAAVGGDAARRDANEAAQIRSAALTVLSHLIATALRDPSFQGLATDAAAEIFALIDAEAGDDTARPALRAHAIHLLQIRAPALSKTDQERALTVLQSLVREAPPYDELKGAWNFAICSASEFHEGELKILMNKYGFKEIEVPADTPPCPVAWAKYRAFEAPFKSPAGDPIRFYSRVAASRDENLEMAMPFFIGLLINRHAQLGSYDLRAATVKVKQEGYKLMMNSQCAGLTTRFAISRLFPDADIYSSWDSTYFRTGTDGEVTASEGIDCFVACVEGMSHRENHRQLDARITQAQWYHNQSSIPGFAQFVGPAHPLVVARYSDVNQDGRADFYDGFLDFYLAEIAEDIQRSMTPRDPGVSATQISGEAAHGLGWAAGSMNRVTQYSDIWAGLLGESEIYYAFSSGGFFSHLEPPEDVASGKDEPRRDLGRLPAVVRYTKTEAAEGGFVAEVMFHSWLSHSAKELKRLICAAEAMQKAFDLGYLTGDKVLMSPEGKRAAILLTMAGLLEFPADQNFIDGLWAMALKELRLPEISRSVVRACMTEADHELSNYYGSRRGLRQLLSALEKSDPVTYQGLKSEDPLVGRAMELSFDGTQPS